MLLFFSWSYCWTLPNREAESRLGHPPTVLLLGHRVNYSQTQDHWWFYSEKKREYRDQSLSCSMWVTDIQIQYVLGLLNNNWTQSRPNLYLILATCQASWWALAVSQPSKEVVVVLPNLQMRKLRPRESSNIPRANMWWNLDSNLVLP